MPVQTEASCPIMSVDTTTNSSGATLRMQFARLRELIIRRRIFISMLVFSTMMIVDLVSKVVPKDLASPGDPVTLCGLAGVLGGLALRSWAAGFLIKNDRLTTEGPYAFARNPLYLGSFLMIVGFCLLIDDLMNVWIMLVVIPIIYVPKVLSEERLLAKMYPTEWPRYTARTARFSPRRFSWPTLSGWRLSQWMLSREYNAVVAVTAALIGLKIWHDQFMH